MKNIYSLWTIRDLKKALFQALRNIKNGHADQSTFEIATVVVKELKRRGYKMVFRPTA